MKLTDYVAREPQHVLLFGDPGTGKSTLASKLAAKFKLIWISMDNGQAVLKKLPLEQQANIELIMLPDTRDYPVAVDTVRMIFDRKPIHVCDQHGKHNCTICAKAGASFTDFDFSAPIPLDTIVVFDNLSQLSDSYLSLITKGKPVDYKLQLDDWGALRFHLLKALTDIQQAPYNLVAIAHSVEEAMVDGSKKIMPAVGSSQFAPKVTGYFDHVVYCALLNKSHKFGSSTTYATNVITKSRTDVAIEALKEASLEGFFNDPPAKQLASPSTKQVLADAATQVAATKQQPESTAASAAPTAVESSAPVATAAAVVTPAPVPPATDTLSPLERARKIMADMKRNKGQQA